jgi:group II intron reverse transcriptase/maturase
VREVARRDKEARFTALLHHVSLARLRWAYWALSPKAAPGVDGVTWHQYGQELEANLQDLHERVQQGRYRAVPSRRVYIPKADGRLRPLGIAALEDKIVQRAVVEVLNAIYEADFRGFSYGFRPGRGPHQALDALAAGIERKKVNWVLDADIRDFFDRLDRGLVLECLRERVSDRKVLRLIRAILSAGVLDGSVLSDTGEGTPQGGPLSPLMANVVLHRLDRRWQERHGRLGVLVRYADDLCVCAPTRDRAEAALAVLAETLEGLKLKLSESKTRIVGVATGEQGYDFLGFHHRMVPSRRRPAVRYPACWPSGKAMSRARSVIKEMTGRHRRHLPTGLLVFQLNQFLRGWRQYYRYGNSSRCFAKLDRYVKERMALLLSKRHGRRGRGYGLKLIIGSGNNLGLERLTGTIEFNRTAHAAR